MDWRGWAGDEEQSLHWLVRETLPLNAWFFGNISEHVTLDCPLIGFPGKHFFHGTWTYHQLIMRCTRRSPRKSWIYSLYSNPMKNLDDFSFNDWWRNVASQHLWDPGASLWHTDSRTDTHTHIPIIFVSIGMAQMRLKTVLWNILRELLPRLVHPDWFLAQGPNSPPYGMRIIWSQATLVAISVPISMSTSLPLYTYTDLHVWLKKHINRYINTEYSIQY